MVSPIRLWPAAAALAIAAVAAPRPATAGVITDDVVVAIPSFSPSGASGQHDTFKITFDPSLTYTNAAATLVSSSVSLPNPLTFSWQSGQLFFRDDLSGTSPDYIRVSISGLTDVSNNLAPASGNLNFSVYDNGTTQFTGNGGTYQISQVTSVATPEPASLAVLGAGLAGLVLVRRRRAATRVLNAA